MKAKIKYVSVKLNRLWSPEDLAYLKGNIYNRSNIQLAKLMGRSISSLESMKRNINNGKKTVPEFWYKPYLHKKPSYADWISKTESYFRMYNLHNEVSGVKDSTSIIKEVAQSTPEAKMEKRVDKVPTCADTKLSSLKINIQPTKQQSKDMIIALGWVAVLMMLVLVVYYLIN